MSPDTCKVLIVDNDPLVLSSITDLLKRAGYFEIITASDGYEGWLKVLQACPQCLILNFALPRMSGCGLCRRLRAHGSRLPIILVSAHNTVVERDWSMVQGADRFLPIPFTAEMLIQSIYSVLPDLRPPATPKQLEANLSTTDQQHSAHLTPLIQELQLGRRSGVLTLRRGEWIDAEVASIRFVNGQISEACAGRRKGAEARNWIFGWGACWFTFVADEKAEELSGGPHLK